MSDLLPCPFCGCAMRKRQHSAFHPTATVGKPWCWLSTAGEFGGCYELDEGDYAAWNRRTPASTVLPEARSADTPTSPNAREAALREPKTMADYAARRIIKRAKYAMRSLSADEHDALCVARALLSPGGEREVVEVQKAFQHSISPERCFGCRYAGRSLSTSSGE